MMNIKNMHRTSLWTFIMFSLNINQASGIIPLPGQTQEYCQFETFSPVCNTNEVVVIESAIYGRMKLGRCVTRAYGYIGCSHNILKEMDRMCSGLNKCETSLPSRNMLTPESCPEDLTWYMEVSYRCQHVYSTKNRVCHSPEVISVGTASKYIASITTKNTSCGLHHAPWILEAPQGLQISISVMDFSWENTTGNDSCDRSLYGYILDLESDELINICGGENRTQELYKSIGNRVQIVIDTYSMGENRFLLEYKACSGAGEGVTPCLFTLLCGFGLYINTYYL